MVCTMAETIATGVNMRVAIAIALIWILSSSSFAQTRPDHIPTPRGPSGLEARPEERVVDEAETGRRTPPTSTSTDPERRP